MRISRENQRLLVAIALCAGLGLVVAQFLERGMGVTGDKRRVLELAEPLARCATREQYLELLKREYPAEAGLWQSPLMRVAVGETTPPATLARLPDGRLKVVVTAIRPGQLLERKAYAYVPAALVDGRGRGRRLEDVRLNSRGDDLVFEYYFGGEAAGLGESDAGESGGRFRFFMGPREWQLRIAEREIAAGGS